MNSEASFETIPPAPVLQTISDISFERVEPGTPEAIDALVVTDTGNESEEKLLAKAKAETIRLNWWLKDYWQSQGIPREQISVSARDLDIELYNYGGDLTLEQTKEMKKILGILAQASIPGQSQRIKYITIRNEDEWNDQNDENKRGYAFNQQKMITLYPRAMSEEGHRIENVSGFAGTLAHEFGHIYISIDPNMRQEWMKQFGWRYLEDEEVDRTKKAPRRYETNQPERCISDYALFSPDEDICESLAALINNPEKLDPERLAFIKSHWFTDTSAEESSVTLERKTGNEIELPKAPTKISYRAELSKFKIGNIVKK